MRHQVAVTITDVNYREYETVLTIAIKDDSEIEIDEKIMKKAEEFCKSRYTKLEMWEMQEVNNNEQFSKHP